MNTYKNLIFISLAMIFLSNLSIAQTNLDEIKHENFDDFILDFYPEYQQGSDERNFNKGSFFLDQTRIQSQHNPKNLNVADYWNITMGLINVKAPLHLIEIAFDKAIAADGQRFYEYGQHLSFGQIPDLLPEKFQAFEKEFEPRKDRPSM